MKRAFFSLPGPMPVKVVLAAVIIVIALIVLLSVYEWMGDNLLDTGGSIE